MNELLEQIECIEWLHRFKLSDGTEIGCESSSETEDFNLARKELLDSVLNPIFEDNWSQTSVIDVSCKQGYFALPFAQKGARVTGIDATRCHVNAANLMATALDVSSKFKAKRTVIDDVMPEKYGRFDIVLMLGFIYHLENPVAAIRTAYSVCKNMCVIETHVLTGQELSEQAHVSVVHSVDEPKGFEETQSNDLCLVPNKHALLMMMETVGFKRTQVIEVSSHLDNAHLLKKRVMVVGFK